MNITARYIDEQPIEGPSKRYTLRQFHSSDGNDPVILWVYIAEDGAVHPRIQLAKQRAQPLTGVRLLLWMMFPKWMTRRKLRRAVDELALERELRRVDEQIKNGPPCKCGDPRCVNGALGLRCRGPLWITPRRDGTP